MWPPIDCDAHLIKFNRVGLCLLLSQATQWYGTNISSWGYYYITSSLNMFYSSVCSFSLRFRFSVYFNNSIGWFYGWFDCSQTKGSLPRPTISQCWYEIAKSALDFKAGLILICYTDQDLSWRVGVISLCLVNSGYLQLGVVNIFSSALVLLATSALLLSWGYCLFLLQQTISVDIHTLMWLQHGCDSGAEYVSRE